jgi:hypothetical protein
VIEVEKDLIALLSAEEDRLFELRNAYDDNVKAQERAELEKEQQRMSDIRVRIERIRAMPFACQGQPAAVIEETLQRVKLLVIDLSYEEFGDAAVITRQQAILQLEQMYEAAMAAEAETERLRLEALETARRKAAVEAEEQRQRDDAAVRDSRMNAITNMHRLPVEAQQYADPAPIAVLLDEVTNWPVTGQAFGDLLILAQLVKSTTMGELQRLLKAAQARDAQKALDEAKTLRADEEAEPETAVSLEQELGLSGSVVTDFRQSNTQATPKSVVPEIAKNWRPSVAAIVNVLATTYNREHGEILTWLQSVNWNDPNVLDAAA